MLTSAPQIKKIQIQSIKAPPIYDRKSLKSKMQSMNTPKIYDCKAKKSKCGQYIPWKCMTANFKMLKQVKYIAKRAILRLFLTASAPYFILSLSMMIAFLALHHFIFDVFFIENAWPLADILQDRNNGFPFLRQHIFYPWWNLIIRFSVNNSIFYQVF